MEWRVPVGGGVESSDDERSMICRKECAGRIGAERDESSVCFGGEACCE